MRKITGVTGGNALANNTYTNFQAGMTGPSHKQNKLKQSNLHSMYKPSGRMTPFDYNDSEVTPKCESFDD